MKHIHVVAAILRDKNRILATCRKDGEFAGLWEFPGGKVEPGETEPEALRREIQEELDLDMEVESHLVTVEHAYEHFTMTMACYLGHIVRGDMTLHAHEAVRWLGVDELDSVTWLPADVGVVEALRTWYREHGEA